MKPRQYRTTYTWHDNLQGYLFASPWLAGFFFFLLGPMIFSLVLCFLRWNGITSLGTAEWVGAAHFADLAQDELFYIALYNTAYYACLSVPMGIVFSLLLAMMLNQQLEGISLFRTIFYLPNVVAGVATIMMWRWIFNPDFGALNFVLENIGVEHPPTWLQSEVWAKPAFIIMSLWRVGGSMLIYLAGLQNIPQHLYEVAAIDGASRIRRFFNVTIPMLTPTIFFNLIMSIIGSFQIFSTAYLMRQNADGGPNNATLFYVLYLYRKAFQHFEMGYASAMAWILFGIILCLTLIVIRSSRLWVFYEGERTR